MSTTTPLYSTIVWKLYQHCLKPEKEENTLCISYEYTTPKCKVTTVHVAMCADKRCKNVKFQSPIIESMQQLKSLYWQYVRFVDVVSQMKKELHHGSNIQVSLCWKQSMHCSNPLQVYNAVNNAAAAQLLDVLMQHFTPNTHHLSCSLYMDGGAVDIHDIFIVLEQVVVFLENPIMW